jgi:phosphoribosylamine---glycine ligase
MRVLIIGKGGREHAMAKALLSSKAVEKLYALPGNHGMEPEVQIFKDLKIEVPLIIEMSQKYNIDLIIVGPEDPLVAGIADKLRDAGLLVFGPDQKSAQLEGSKIFAKEFMNRYKIPTAKYIKVLTVDETLEEAKKFTPPYVLKADGLAAGKGVFICKDLFDLKRDAKKIFEDKILGSSGDEAILEQFQKGYELSFFILTNGSQYVSLPMAQDHKKLLDDDKGPNTGGMGTVAPIKISDELYQEIIKDVVEPTVQGLKQESYVYRGVVFIGLMITDNGPQVLEYNVRFGDPETQVLLPLLDGDWADAFYKIAQGDVPKLEWQNNAAACVVMAAENYPDNPVKGSKITGQLKNSDEQYFLHAGTDKYNEDWVTSGGRVLNSIGIGHNLSEAINKAYEQSQKASWKGLQKRNDIGLKSK